MQTDDGSDDVVIVPRNYLNEFRIYADMYRDSKGTRPVFDSRGWNAYWKDEFGLALRQLSSRELMVSGFFHDKTSRNAAIAYMLNNSNSNFQRMYWSEFKAQWTDPEHVINSLAMGVMAWQGLFGLKNVATNGIPDIVVHGNSLKSMKPTWGYKLYSNDGSFLKNGITSKLKPESRYTKAFMKDKVMREKLLFPTRIEAWKWEYRQNKKLRGPLNKNMH